MTTEQRFDRDLPDLLAQLAPRVTPDYRDDVVRQTASLRQRPAWTFPERWLPMDITFAPARGRPRSVAVFLATVVVALLLGAMLLAYVGSTTRVPPPFGPARNGALFYAADGDIYRLDSLTSEPRPIITGPADDGWALPSRDGRSLAVSRPVSGGTQVLIADSEGRGLRPLAGAYADFSEIDWSPTGEQLAVISSVDGVPTLSILESDGSAARTLDLGMEPSSFWYLADGRILFKGMTSTTSGPAFGLYTVDPAGGDPTPITPISRVEGTWIDPVPSDDGRSVVYHRWDETVHGQLRVLDIASGTDVAVDGSAVGGIEDEGARFSPDGQTILFTRFSAADNTLAVTSRTGGAVREIGERTPGNTMALSFFSPDGRSVLAFYRETRHLWLLDPTGATPDQQLDLPVTDTPTWQRTAD